MLYPLERLEDVCALTVEESSRLLVKAREGGNTDALADWTARSIYLHFKRRDGLDHDRALEATRALLSEVDLDPKVVDG